MVLAGCELANLSTKGQHATSRPPKPLTASRDVGRINISMFADSVVNIIGLSVLLHVHSTIILIVTVDTTSCVVLADTAGMLY
jgi:hypothetical protein